MTGSFGDGIPIPDVIDPPDSMPMTLCIPRNRDHMAAFFGALYQLTIWNSWQQNGTTQGKELAAVWWRYYLSWNRNMNDLECEDGMANCCTEPEILKRINPTTGQVEQSTNGGSTWTPAANTFTSLIVQPVPPVTSGVAGTKCDAATNVSNQVDVWINQVSNDFTTATTLTEFGLAVIAAIAGAVLVVITGGGLLPIELQLLAVLGAAFAAAWGAGKVVFDDYWTTDIKNVILCAAYCTIGEDGSFSAAQSSEFWNRVNTQLPPSPAKMLFMGFLSSVGRAGLNAMAASGFSADADCADCACSCDPFSWSVTILDGQAVGSIIARGSNFITVRSVNHHSFGGYTGEISVQTNGDSVCCRIISLTYLTGEPNADMIPFDVDCGLPRYPASPMGSWDGSTDSNSFQIRKPPSVGSTQFDVKITFG